VTGLTLATARRRNSAHPRGHTHARLRDRPPTPSRLRCGLCGQAVAALADAGAGPPGELTAGQAGHAWPGLGEGVLASTLPNVEGDTGGIVFGVPPVLAG
jgi:hypothetical protein